MKLSELIFIVVFAGIPVWLVLRAWFKYRTLSGDPLGDVVQMRMGLTLVSATTVMWIFVFGLMLLADHNDTARTLAQNMSPVTLGFFNLALSIGGLSCSLLRRRSAHRSLPLRRAIGVSSAYLALAWLFVLGNPH